MLMSSVPDQHLCKRLFDVDMTFSQWLWKKNARELYSAMVFIVV